MTTKSPVESSSGVLARAMSAMMALDVAALRARLEQLRSSYPDAQPIALARRIYRSGSWKAAGAGFLGGLAGPATALPAALGEAVVVMRTQLIAAAMVAELYEPGFLDHPDVGWHLLVPIMGASALSQMLRELGVDAAQTLTRRTLRRLLDKKALQRFQRWTLAHLGKRVTRKALVSKAVPIVGGLVGGGWDLLEVRAVGRRVIAFFEGQPKA
jgi:hypothetical protein